MTPAVFSARTSHVSFAERGMFFSEGYLFAKACADHGVTLVIESGVCNGVSTRLLHALFPFRVLSIEADIARLSKPFDWPVVIGDGVRLVPILIERHRDERIGLLLDGPKNKRARALRDQAFKAPHVHVVGIHDEPVGGGELAHSLDPDVRASVGYLDARVPAGIRAKYPLGAPGLALWWRTEGVS